MSPPGAGDSLVFPCHPSQDQLPHGTVRQEVGGTRPRCSKRTANSATHSLRGLAMLATALSGPTAPRGLGPTALPKPGDVGPGPTAPLQPGPRSSPRPGDTGPATTVPTTPGTRGPALQLPQVWGHGARPHGSPEHKAPRVLPAPGTRSRTPQFPQPRGVAWSQGRTSVPPAGRRAPRPPRPRRAPPCWTAPLWPFASVVAPANPPSTRSQRERRPERPQLGSSSRPLPPPPQWLFRYPGDGRWRPQVSARPLPACGGWDAAGSSGTRSPGLRGLPLHRGGVEGKHPRGRLLGWGGPR